MKKLEIGKLGIQIFFSTIIIGLCGVHLMSNKTEEHQKLYWSGLSFVLAYWLPLPKGSQVESLIPQVDNLEQE
ncbi:MAG: hypothetical protein QNJ47_03135 [Nostocaceae cyanobacterium]|nr:hypothetical protein [Nostocaceae cyanobacterium]